MKWSWLGLLLKLFFPVTVTSTLLTLACVCLCPWKFVSKTAFKKFYVQHSCTAVLHENLNLSPGDLVLATDILQVVSPTMIY